MPIAPVSASHSSETPIRRRPSYAPADPLLTAREAAAETGRAISTFYRDLKAGTLPQACVMVGRSPRWRRSALRVALGIAA